MHLPHFHPIPTPTPTPNPNPNPKPKPNPKPNPKPKPKPQHHINSYATAYNSNDPRTISSTNVDLVYMKICELPALPNDATTCQSNWDQNSYYEWIKESTGMTLPYNTMEEVESHFRNSALYYEKVRICTTADSNEDDAQCSEVAFDKTANIVTGSLMNMIKTTLVMIILIWANLSFGKGERAPKRQHPQLILYLTHNTKQTNQFIPQTPKIWC